MNINFSNHIESLANRFGDQEAIVNIERNRRYTFAEFHLLSNRIVNMMMATLGPVSYTHLTLPTNREV